jgi:hypothetical protein
LEAALATIGFHSTQLSILTFDNQTLPKP